MKLHPRVFFFFAMGTLIGACGAGARRGSTFPDVAVPAEINATNYLAATRIYHGLAIADPERAALRTRIVGHLSKQTAAIVASEDYDGAVDHFLQMTTLLAPEEFEQTRLPSGLRKIALYLHKEGSRRGDEGRVLAALYVLRKLEPSRPRWSAEYAEVAKWGRSARRNVSNVLDRFTQLVRVWDEHARLTPATEVLASLAELHVARRQGVLRAVREGKAGELARLRLLPSQITRAAPLDIASLYLQHGEIAPAIARIRSMKSGAHETERLLAILDIANKNDSEGLDALAELAEAFRQSRPEVATGVCRLGLRRAPADARFPACLARAAAERGDFAQSTGWYGVAIRRAPTVRNLYDEALDRLNEFIRAGLFDSDPTQARAMAREAEQILHQRNRRWPREPASVPSERLQFLVGVLEMNAGNADEALRRFRRSLKIRETPTALRQLGLLLYRTGQSRAAAGRLRRALDITPGVTLANAVQRAEILEHLGDAFRAADEKDKAQRMYRQALELWSSAGSQLRGRPLAMSQARRGVLLQRLGRDKDAHVAFRDAMSTAPSWRETYASILSHLVVSDPDVAFAEEVFRRAQRGLTLEPEWKVYFALWVQAIGGRAGKNPTNEVNTTLQDMAKSESWWGQLARFGTGTLPFADLLKSAADVGQETEAHFYEGTRLMARGDVPGAQRQFRRVVAMRMVSFYEFMMARELGDGLTGADLRGGRVRGERLRKEN